VAPIASLIVLALCAASAHAECGASAAEISQLRRLLETDPTASAQSAIAGGGAEFLGVAGYSISVPGIDGTNCGIDRALIRVIPGTTDFRCGPEHSELIRRASTFAQQYNSVVKAFLVAKGALRCE
jgi:hypothetical protein